MYDIFPRDKQSHMGRYLKIIKRVKIMLISSIFVEMIMVARKDTAGIACSD
jgi:hypothetical protein